MSYCQEEIKRITGCLPEDASKIEQIMREDVVHSTLDWLTAKQFARAAKKAQQLLETNREMYETHFAQIRAFFDAKR